MTLGNLKCGEETRWWKILVPWSSVVESGLVWKVRPHWTWFQWSCEGRTSVAVLVSSISLVDSGTRLGLETHSGSVSELVLLEQRHQGMEPVGMLSPVLPTGTQ